MADISKEIAKKDAQKLFDSIGSFTNTRWISTGEKGNTVVELKKIIEKYKFSSSLLLLESEYEKLYFKKGSLKTIEELAPEWAGTIRGNSASLELLESAYEEIYNTGINTTLKGEFSGLDSLKTRIDGLKSENPGKSLLELDLIDEEEKQLNKKIKTATDKLKKDSDGI